MKRALLEILRCPFCGGRPVVAEGTRAPAAAVNDERSITHGILFCSCRAYPVVDGVPYLCDTDRADQAVALLNSGQATHARDVLLEVTKDERRQQQLHKLLASREGATYGSLLRVFADNPEGDYFLHRFSDPYFVSSDALIRSVGAPRSPLPAGRAIDVCGGCGHLTRSMLRAGKFSEVVLSDVSYWKIWLGSKFIAPDAHTVVCDADLALPFARDCFSLALCSGSFEYVWSRRSFGEELQRLAGSRGLVLVTHVRNMLCQTFNPGMPLEPAGYRGIFAHQPSRLFAESTMIDAALAGGPIDLSAGRTDDELADEGLLIIASARDESLLCPYELPRARHPAGRIAVNPLYSADAARGNGALRLQFPTPEYEDEFGQCRRYLPEALMLTPAQRARLNASSLGDEALLSLLDRRALLELPDRYV